MTGDPPLVSVVIPCHNAATTVAEAISSALAQTHPATEIVVVDDGSVDDSRSVLAQFGERIRWQACEWAGGNAARNRGIELSRGRYLQFLDADDVLYPGKIERCLGAVRDPREICFSDHVVIGTDGTRAVRAPTTELPDDPLQLVLRHRTLLTSGGLYPRSLLTECGGFRAGLRGSQEFELNLRIAMLPGVRWRHVPEPLFEVRRRELSVSSNTARVMGYVAGFLPELVERWQAAEQLDPPRIQALAGYAAATARLLLRLDAQSEGWILMNLALRLHPGAARQAAYGPLARVMTRLLGVGAVEALARMRRKLRGR